LNFQEGGAKEDGSREQADHKTQGVSS
jgi:hypothetical protein